MIQVGCCGWQKAHDTYYQHFSLIEVQKTFYKPPMVRTVRRWRKDEAPSDFIFTLKAWQLITHDPSSPTYHKADLDIPDEKRDRYGTFRPTDEVFEAWDRTREIADTLAAPIVLFQCPPSFEPTDEHKENMRAFFGEIERGDFIFAWEPRGEWQDTEIAQLCDDLDLVHCVDPFERLPVTDGLAYFRLHGIDGYYYNYADDNLDRLQAWCDPFDEAYVLFNNVSMWDDALRFQEALGSK